MDLRWFNKKLKQYNHSNPISAFSTELLTMGSTSIPNLLLKFYKQIDITDLEMMLIIQMLRLRTEEANLNPTLEYLAECLTSSVETIKKSLDNLLEKQIIMLTQYYDEERDETLTVYDLEPMMEKLSELWACAKMQEIEKTKFLLNAKARQKSDRASLNLFRIFEKEFGRPLSPMEVAQIEKWLEDFEQQEMILEALRRAVLMGKHNFKYIDGILLEWKKNNLRTPRDIEKYDRDFKHRKNKSTSAKHKQKENSEDQKERDFIKTLYMS